MFSICTENKNSGTKSYNITLALMSLLNVSMRGAKLISPPFWTLDLSTFLSHISLVHFILPYASTLLLIHSLHCMYLSVDVVLIGFNHTSSLKSAFWHVNAWLLVTHFIIIWHSGRSHSTWFVHFFLYFKGFYVVVCSKLHVLHFWLHVM